MPGTEPFKFLPNRVNKENERALWQYLYGKEFAKTRKRFNHNLGDTVRISQIRGTFEKGFTPIFSREYFIVAHRKNTVPQMYKLRDEEGELLEGSFYEFEIQGIRRLDERHAFLVDVLKTRRGGKKKDYFVHYRGWPSSHDHWIPADHLGNVRGR
ncbi:uncharacterized protein LOC135502633 [Lineus longissimus]|uniref:uncharacterized protein LOC135502633 n=1 Tax=Lineus longissimus TaxID=88925 RepID=UPI00315C5EF9